MISYIKKMLPDAHKIIFDFHVELAYQKMLKDIPPPISSNNRTIFDGPYSMDFHRTIKISQDAIDVGKIVYHTAHRPQVGLFIDFLDANEKFLEASQRYSRDTIPEQLRNAYDRLIRIQEQLDNLRANNPLQVQVI